MISVILACALMIALESHNGVRAKKLTRKSVIEDAMGLSPAFPIPRDEEGDEPRTFEDAVIEDSERFKENKESMKSFSRIDVSGHIKDSRSAHSAASDNMRSYRFSEHSANAEDAGALSKSGGKDQKGGEGDEKTSSIGCCKLCPEQFEGIDIIPSQSFLQLDEFIANGFSGGGPAGVSSVRASSRKKSDRERFTNDDNHMSVDINTFEPFETRAGERKTDAAFASERFVERREATYAGEADASASAKASKGGETKAPPPPPVPLTIEQLIDQTPCCPVCLEQFNPPVDADDSAFVELGESVRPREASKRSRDAEVEPAFLETKQRRMGMSTGTRFSLGSRSTGKEVKPLCCTMCPNDEIPAGGTFDAGKSFLETGEETSRVMKGGSDAKGGGNEDKRVKSDGCCNQCPASMFEGADIRFQEPQGGPFGLQPRLKSVSGAFPLQQPPTG